MKVYTVRAKLKAEDGEILTVWHFTAITTTSPEHAIEEVKATMLSVLGHFSPDYIWEAESVWENNQGVN